MRADKQGKLWIGTVRRTTGYVRMVHGMISSDRPEGRFRPHCTGHVAASAIRGVATSEYPNHFEEIGSGRKVL